MPVNVGTMRALVLSRARKSINLFSNDNNSASSKYMLLRWMNEISVDVAGRHDYPFMMASATVNTVASAPQVTLASNFRRLINLWQTVSPLRTRGIPLRKFRGEIPDPTTTGVPELYTVNQQRKLFLYPIPASAYTMKYQYYAWTGELTTDTSFIGFGTSSASTFVSGIQMMYEKSVMDGVYWMAMEHAGADNLAAKAEIGYEKSISKLWFYSNNDSDQWIELRDNADDYRLGRRDPRWPDEVS